MRATELSIIIPCYNNAETLPDTVRELNDIVAHNSMNVETLIIDDQSEDNSLDVARGFIGQYPALHARVFERNRRFHATGSVVRFGLAYATGRSCVIVQADGSDPIELLPTFLKKLREGAQLVQCTRFATKETEATVGKRFRVYQRLYRSATRMLLGANFTDTTNGFRAFNRKFVCALGLFSGRMNVYPEITFKVHLAGGTIEYVPGVERHSSNHHPGQFKLRREIAGYANVLLRAALHRRGIAWF